MGQYAHMLKTVLYILGNCLCEIEKTCPHQRYELFTSDKSVKNLKLYERLGYIRFKEQNVAPELKFIYLEK